MRRTARFPRLSDFPEQVREVNASSPPAAFRDLGRFRLVQVEHLLVDAYLMFELAAQAAQDDEELLKALQRPVGNCVPATEYCRALPLWRGEARGPARHEHGGWVCWASQAQPNLRGGSAALRE